MQLRTVKVPSHARDELTHGQDKGGLVKNSDFNRLWFGQSVSQFGNQITLLALPTVAILVLHFSVFMVGVLGAVEFLAFPVIGLFVGVLVDRSARRPILIMCNLGRLASLATIPIGFALNFLSDYQIFAIAGLNGVFTVFFDVAYQSYLPSIVEAKDLVEGNSKLQGSASAASAVGPALAGFLIGAIGAAVSILIDVAGYGVSVLAMTSIRKKEARDGPSHDGERRDFMRELREGVSLLLHSRLLAGLTGCVSMANLGSSIANAVFLFFAYNQLGLTTFEVGIVLTAGGVAFFLGSLIAGRVSKKLGMGRALTISLTSQLAWVGYPLALVYPAVPTLMIFTAVLYFPVLIFNILALSMTQRVTPNRMLGRVNGTRRTISYGMIPLGSFLGGVMGGVIGLSWTMVVGGLVAGGSVLWALASPIYKAREDNELDLFAVSRLQADLEK